MSNKQQWIREVAEEVSCPISNVQEAVQKSGAEINNKYDVLICYTRWSMPHYKELAKENLQLKKEVTRLEQVVNNLSRALSNLKIDFDKQMEDKNKLIDLQNTILSRLSRITSEIQRNIG